MSTVSINFVSKSSNNVLKTIVEAIQPQIDTMVMSQLDWMRKNDHRIGKYDEQMIELGLIYDLARSVVSYTLDTDTIQHFNVQEGYNGSLEMTGDIVRDGEPYYFSTQVITAGGYNIQCLHYRYLTTTSLPKAQNKEVAKGIKKEVRRLSSINDLKSEIEVKSQFISLLSSTVDALEDRPDEQWIQICKERGDWLENNWSTRTDEDLFCLAEYSDIHNEEQYVKWINLMNEQKIDTLKEEINHIKRDIRSHSKSIEVAQKRIDKLTN